MLLCSACLVLPSAAAPAGESAADAFHAVWKSRDTQAYSRAARQLRRWRIKSDPNRPLYHFSGPEGLINDPNGPIYHEGRYHLFYQWAHPSIGGDSRCWGHAVSSNLVHWVDWPVALWPDSPWDRNGVYSGNTIIDSAGRINAFYTGNVAGRGDTYGMRAFTSDGGLHWEKRVVMKEHPNPQSPVHWDGQVWKEDGLWYQLIAGTVDGRGNGMLWSSPDLEQWTFIKPILPAGAIDLKEAAIDLPYLVSLGGKYMFMCGLWPKGNPYWLGAYDRRSHTFTPDKFEPESFDSGDYYSFNPNLTDNRGRNGAPRRIVHGWITPGGWAWDGAHSIPRVIRLVHGRLDVQPVPEIEILRGAKHSFARTVLRPGAGEALKGVAGEALEIAATFEPAETVRFGIKVRASGNHPGIPVWFKDRDFGIGDRRSRSDAKPGEPVTMRIFVDRSIIEAYVGGRAITRCTLNGPAGLEIVPFAEDGQAVLRSIDVWEMKGMWD